MPVRYNEDDDKDEFQLMMGLRSTQGVDPVVFKKAEEQGSGPSSDDPFEEYVYYQNRRVKQADYAKAAHELYQSPFFRYSNAIGKAIDDVNQLVPNAVKGIQKVYENSPFAPTDKEKEEPPKDLLAALNAAKEAPERTYGLQLYRNLPPAETFAGKAADFLGRLTVEAAETAYISLVTGGLGLGGKVQSMVSTRLAGKRGAQVLGKMAGTFVNNAAEDLLLDVTRGVAQGKSSKEIMRDYGESLFYDALTAGILEGVPELVRAARKSGKGVSEALGSLTEEAAEAAVNDMIAQYGSLEKAAQAIEESRLLQNFDFTGAGTVLPNAGMDGRIEARGGELYGGQERSVDALHRDTVATYGSAGRGDYETPEGVFGGAAAEVSRRSAESQESFQRRAFEANARADEAGRGLSRITVDQHGSGRIAYRLRDAVDPASPAGKAAQAFEENGIRVVVTDGPFESNLNGLTTRHADAVTAPDGTIYLASSASIDPEHIVPHESVHVLKRTGNSAYDDFYDAMYSHMRYNTPEYNAVADKINQAHYNGRYDINDPDSFDSLFTELSAYIHEFLETDPAYARQLFGGMFDDWDAIVAADRALTDALAGLSRRGKSAARSADDNIDAIIRDVFGYGDAQKKGITEELTEDLLNADASDRIDFYADSRGKLLPAAYKEWLGTSKRDELLGSVNHPKLKKAIDELYRPGSIIGDGGTADIIRFENATGILMSRAGHIQKGIDMTRYLQSFIDEKNLTTDEKRLAQEIIKNLRDALEELPK